MTEKAKHRITISRQLDGPGYVVEVIPPAEIGHAPVLPTHKDAFGYAAGLRMCMGWPLVDLTTGERRG